MSPIRLWTITLILALLALLAPARAADDEPVFRGKKLSEWVNLLHNGKDARHRKQGLMALCGIGPRRSRKVTAALIAAVRQNRDKTIRAGAAFALGGFAAKARPDDDISIEKIRDTLAAGLRTDKADSVRKACAGALGEMKEKAHGAADALALALKDRHAGTRTAAARALHQLGKDARDAVGDLQTALQNAQLELLTRVYCAHALGRIGSPDALTAVPALAKVLGNSKNDGDLRKACAKALGAMGNAAADAAPALARVLTAKDSDAGLRRSAVESLAAMGSAARSVVLALRTALQDDDQFVRAFALHALGRMGGELGEQRKAVVLAILSRMDDNVLEVRIAAIEALAHLGAEGLGEQNEAAVNRLREAARDPQKVIAEAAKAALNKVQKKP